MPTRTLAPLIVLTLTLCLADTCLADLSTGLSGYWQFDGNGNDSSGNGNNLTVVGNPTYGTGLFGGALSLDGTGNQYATLSANPSAFTLATGDYSIQIWVNFNAGINGREQTLLEKFSGASGPGWSISTPGGNTLFGPGLPDTPVTLTTGVWHQVITERTGNLYSLYFDDHLIASQTVTTPITISPNALLFGRRDAQDGRNFGLNGSLDEVAIWGRALSTGEISQLYNNGNGLVIPSSVPEPSSLMLCGIAALTGVIFARRRRDTAV